MNEDLNAVLALKNAWTGAVETSDAVRDLAPSVMGLGDDVTLAGLDLETYHRRALAQSIAVMALRGLIEQLRRKRGDVAELSGP